MLRRAGSDEQSGELPFEADLKNGDDGDTTEKRKRHRAIEQKRRDRTKAILTSLQHILGPSTSAPGGALQQSLSMNEILSKAISALAPAENPEKDTAISRALVAARQQKMPPPRQLCDTSFFISLHALDPTGSYVYASHSCKQMLGYDTADLVGQPAYRFFCPDDMKAINESHILVLGKGKVWSMVYRMRKKDDDMLWVATSSRLTSRGICCVTRRVVAPSDGKPFVILQRVWTLPEDSGTQ